MTTTEDAKPLSSSAAAQSAFIGLAAYASLGAFSLLAHDAARSPDVATRLRLARMAAAELAEFDLAEELLRARGEDPIRMVSQYAGILDGFLKRAEPRDWWERLMRTYVGFNLLEDLVRDLCKSLPADLHEQLHGSVGVSGHADLIAELLLPEVEADPTLASRLALWGRRVVGEAISLAHRILAERPELVELLDGEDDPAARVRALVARLQANHSRRMGRLGLTS